MEENYLNNLNHDLTFRVGIIKEALAKRIKFGSKEFFVYSQLRWYETDGKFGFCVAGNERLGEDVGLSEIEVEHALRGLKDAGLIEHIWCDKKVYRNKTKLWVSTVRLAAVYTNVDAIKVLNNGRRNKAFLGKTSSGNEETSSGNEETSSGNEGRSSVVTGVGNTNRNTKRKRTDSSDVANAPSSSSNPSPFFSPVNKTDENLAGTAIDLKSHEDTKRTCILVNEIVDLMRSPIKGKKTILKKRIEERLADGFSEIELKQVARWSTTQQDDFYKNPYSLFSETGFAGALTKMDNDKPKLTTMRTI